MTEMKTRILFVDDEANLLQGLRRMLRGQRSVWDMRFANSGAEALAALADNPADVIVTDMRMPEMDGAQLLETVRERYPGMIRIVLSGYANNEAVIRAVGPSHRYLAKPCEPEVLIDTIQRSLKLHDSLADPGLRELVANLQSVPTPSKTYRALMTELESETATAHSVGAILESDVALAALTMKLMNSAYFGLPMRINGCRQAVQLLGFDTIRSVVALGGLFQEYAGDSGLTRQLEALSERSMAIGALARELAIDLGWSQEACQLACGAGLLSHVGTLILLANRPETSRQVLTACKAHDAPVCETEASFIGANHAQLGAYLLGLWGYPDDLVEAVAFHHEPGAAGTKFTLAGVINVAQALTAKHGYHDHDSELLICSKLDIAHLEQTGSIERLPDWCLLAEKLVSEG